MVIRIRILTVLFLYNCSQLKGHIQQVTHKYTYAYMYICIGMYVYISCIVNLQFFIQLKGLKLR